MPGMAEPRVVEIKAGWLAMGTGWAVQGASREEALVAFTEAERLHAKIDARPLPPPNPDTAP